MLHDVGQPGPSREWLVLFLLWSFATGLNLMKPFHMDDTAHLLIAAHILEDPLHPMSGLLNWLDTAEPIFVTNQPHFLFYLIAGTAAIFGWSELAMHLMISGFTLLAILASFAIAKRFIPRHALMLVAFLVLGPGFLINQNVMVDIPLLALMSAAFWVLIAQRKGHLPGAVGFSLFSLAVLTKYTAVFLYPALLIAALSDRRKIAWAWLPIAALAAWSLFNRYDFGAVHMLARPTNEGGIVPSPKLAFSLLVNLGVFTAPLAALLIISARPRLVWLALFVLGMALYLLAAFRVLDYVVEEFSLWNAALFASSVVVGSAVLLRVWQLVVSWTNKQALAVWFARNRAEVALILWIAGGGVFLSTFPPFMATRHALLLAMPIGIVALKAVDLSLGKASVGAVLVAWGAVGLFVFANDLSFARFYRDQAASTALTAREIAGPGAQVFSRGHWGWQWYAAQAGMLEFDTLRTTLSSGDILVDPVGISSQRLPDGIEFELLQTVRQQPNPFTVLDMHRFYASALSTAPVIGRAQAREVRILRVK